jgi:hypothetical protein
MINEYCLCISLGELIEEHYPSKNHAVLSTLVHRARGLCVRRAVMWSWCSWEKLSGRTSTLADRFVGTSNFPQEFPSPTKSQIQSFSFLMLGRYSPASARCCLGTSVLWVSLPDFFGRSRMIWDWRSREYTAFPVSVVWATLDRRNGPLDWRQVEGTVATFSTRTLDKSDIAEHSINLGQSVQLHHTVILSIKRRYRDPTTRRRFRYTVRTGKMLFLGNLSFAPWNIVESLHHMRVDLTSPWDKADPCILNNICSSKTLTRLRPDVTASICYLRSLIPTACL